MSRTLRRGCSFRPSKVRNIGALVDQVCRMVIISRNTYEPDWHNRPATSTMLVSILLTSHYAGRPYQGEGMRVRRFNSLGRWRGVGWVGEKVV